MTSVATRPNESLPSCFTDEARWRAVQRRDAAADGAFCYSVLTTGVYCRPSCPSRTAKRENVVFHATCAAAEAAGFRPCKRCLPAETALAERHGSGTVREEKGNIPDGAVPFLSCTIGTCWLGTILVATSDKGICAILLGDDPDILRRALDERFPQAHLAEGGEALAQVTAKVIGFVEAPKQGLDPPLDRRGTPFQQRV